MALIHPSYREKRRYLLVKCENYEEFKKKFFDTFIYFFGIYGLAKAGILFLDDLYDPNKKLCIIRVSKSYLHYAIVILYLINAELLGIFPTLKRLKEKIKS